MNDIKPGLTTEYLKHLEQRLSEVQFQNKKLKRVVETCEKVRARMVHEAKMKERDRFRDHVRRNAKLVQELLTEEVAIVSADKVDKAQRRDGIPMTQILRVLHALDIKIEGFE